MQSVSHVIIWYASHIMTTNYVLQWREINNSFWWLTRLILNPSSL